VAAQRIPVRLRDMHMASDVLECGVFVRCCR
jgi:hypothetical protein